ncbi:tetratricopeptide repeat protein [Brevibacillus laterosporus]|uniref:tetratricopeptide repeat protein n=1 Tax=Brevibacillus laterosporus TaxID=1465 RepID=UPI0026529C09|nr:hypothetical protein [Brevibacillus laterosporus]MDN9011556.1 hypothetical protein [Brevibacillus laterosporus]MDO0942620.1 hypothetical protein [Brevibacillus laterosporus]
MEKQELFNNILDLSPVNEIEQIEYFIDSYLHLHPTDIDILLRGAVLVLSPPIADVYKSLDYLEKAITIEPTNHKAWFILSHIHETRLGGIDIRVIEHLSTIHPKEKETQSIIELIKGWYYCKIDDLNNYKSHLQKSIDLAPNLVFNHVELGKLLLDLGYKTESKHQFKIALQNVVKIYSIEEPIMDLTDYDEFINENIKGIYLTEVVVAGYKKYL